MNSELKIKYIKTLMRFNRSGIKLYDCKKLNMTELFIMAGISNSIFGDSDGFDLSKIQEYTHISKAAISQILSSLDKRGYIIRETDKTNRRRITVELTDSGEEILKQTKKRSDQILDEILRRLGEENVLELINLLDKLSNISDDLKEELEAKESEAKNR
ncbi:MAG: winged helix DNA-binding protein [Tissierellia bacterium]|nr:winged helix DNA-binding protein [Tissierellia bacterium]